jgi:hypothetical protein
MTGWRRCRSSARSAGLAALSFTVTFFVSLTVLTGGSPLQPLSAFQQRILTLNGNPWSGTRVRAESIAAQLAAQRSQRIIYRLDKRLANGIAGRPGRRDTDTGVSYRGPLRYASLPPQPRYVVIVIPAPEQSNHGSHGRSDADNAAFGTTLQLR